MEVNNGNLCLEIYDNGPGFNSQKSSNTFGLSLVKELTKRLDGEILIRNEKETKICLMFRKFKVAA